MNRAGQVWDNGDTVGYILDTAVYHEMSPEVWVLHRYIVLYSKHHDAGTIAWWSEELKRPYEGTFLTRIV